MHGENLEVILVLLLAAVVVVAVFKRLNLSPVLGYLVAGMVIGPSGAALIPGSDTTKYIAEFGVVLLLFYIGLELTLERLKAMRRYVVGFGSLQVLITMAVITYTAMHFGYGTKTALIVGGALALSSTAIVLQVLAERGEQATQVGRLSLAVLIAQDLYVVPLMVMIPLFAQEVSNIPLVIAGAMLKAAFAIVAIIVVGRLFLRPLFRVIGSLRSRELFAATTLLIVLGAAWGTEHFGLSLALGAFFAGLMVAETEYCHQVEADILPFKSLLLGLFFMTVGMSIDLEVLKTNANSILSIAVLLILTKAVIVTILCLLARFKVGASIQAGLLLSQGGEFAFVLFGLASTLGVIDSKVSQTLLVTVTITMAITPLLAVLGKKIADKLDKEAGVATDLGDIVEENKDIDKHILVIGFGKVGRSVCELLAASKINYVALDSDAKNVHEGRVKGFPVYYGATDRIEVYQSVGIERAVAVIVTSRDRQEAKRAVTAVRSFFPNMPIIARGWDHSHVKDLEAAGATFAIAEAFEVSMQLGSTILNAMGFAEPEIERIIQDFRLERYSPQSRENLTSGETVPVPNG
ncbi:MAG: potassium transporter [Proteobacteria bacterium]|nr:potassium transporter [Pseudomonadota bacterium]